MQVKIIDVGVGNVGSIYNALCKDYDVQCVQDLTEHEQGTLILPGMGSAKSFMQAIDGVGLTEKIKAHAGRKRRIIGICLGFQILGQFSAEDGGVSGLELLPVYTEYIGNRKTNNGWQNFTLNKNSFANDILKPSRRKKITGRVYYNHELGVKLIKNTDKTKIGYIDYVPNLAPVYISAMQVDNIFGVQFHPEKSQRTGQQLLDWIL